MKDIIMGSKISTASYFKITDINGLNKVEIDYPLVVKPSDSNGSYGVRKVQNKIELLQDAQEALKISRSQSAIIESYLIGREISIDAFVVDKKVKILMKSELKTVKSAKRGFPIFQSIFPARLSPKANDSIGKIANQIVQAFKLSNTPLLIQVIVEQDKVTLIEFGARIGGGSKYRSIQKVTGFNILDAYVATFLGMKPKIVTKPSVDYYSRNHIYTKTGFFGEVKNYGQLIEEGIIEEFIFYKTKGMEISSDMASRDRIGSFLVKADTKEKLMEKVKTAVERLEVYNTKGNAIMRKDIFQGINIQ